jgi:hypothetical protein
VVQVAEELEAEVLAAEAQVVEAAKYRRMMGH